MYNKIWVCAVWKIIRIYKTQIWRKPQEEKTKTKQNEFLKPIDQECSDKYV